MARKLTEMQKQFVAEYLVDLNATQAAIRAGYSDRTAHSQGPRLLENVEIKKLIAAAMEKRGERTEVTADRVIEELAKLAFFDVRNMFNDEGKPKEISELDDVTAACIAGLDVQDSFEYVGDTKVFNGYTKKYKLADKKAALEALGRHLGIFNDKLQISGEISIEAARMINERINEFNTDRGEGS